MVWGLDPPRRCGSAAATQENQRKLNTAKTLSAGRSNGGVSVGSLGSGPSRAGKQKPSQTSKLAGMRSRLEASARCPTSSPLTVCCQNPGLATSGCGRIQDARLSSLNGAEPFPTAQRETSGSRPRPLGRPPPKHQRAGWTSCPGPWERGVACLRERLRSWCRRPPCPDLRGLSERWRAAAGWFSPAVAANASDLSRTHAAGR